MNRTAYETNQDSGRDSDERAIERDEWKLDEAELDAIFQQLPGNLGPC